MPTSSGGGGGSTHNARLIGGLVGSIGGTIVIGSLVVLFLFFKRRQSKVVNHLPDFADDTLADEEKAGFWKLFGANTRASGAGYNDLERQAPKEMSPDYAPETDFEYRGVSNSNNLLTVFRSNTGTRQNLGPGLGTGSLPKSMGHLRINSVAVDAMSDIASGDEPPEYRHDYRDLAGAYNELLHDLTHDMFHDAGLSVLDMGDEAAPSAPLFSAELDSNRSRLRFTEDIA